METKVFTTHVPLDLAGKIDAASVRLQRSRGWIIKQALMDWVEKQQPKQQAGAARGFAEAQAGFDHADATTTEAAARAVARLKTLRQTTTLGNISWQELRDAGRR